MKKTKKAARIILVMLIAIISASALLFTGVNLYVISFTSKYIITPAKAASLSCVDCITVLGARVMSDGSPSYMLESRLDTAIDLYEAGVSEKMLMTGDHGQHEYDEVNTMMEYVLENSDIPKENVFLDHAGFSTYESAYRAKAIFDVEKSVFVTQKYHLYRTVYNARQCGIDAYGVASDDYNWPKMSYYRLREAFAIFKDFFGCLLGVEPTYLGDVIPVSGTAKPSHDK